MEKKKKLAMILAPALAVIFVVAAFVTVSRDRNRFGEESETKIVTKDEIEVTEVVESEQTSEAGETNRNGETNEPAKLSELFKPELEGDSNRVYKEANIIVNLFFCMFFYSIIIYIIYKSILVVYYSILLVEPKKIIKKIVELLEHKKRHKKIDLEKKD